MILPILTKPNPILHQKCTKVKTFDQDLENLAQNMVETLFENHGVGLSAPQIGRLEKIIVVEFNRTRFIDEIDEDEKTSKKNTIIIPLTILVNPKVISFSKTKEVHEEGCLSLPKIELSIERSSEIKVLAQDLKGNRIKIRAKGLFCRVLQHEIDHLSGILITDKK